MSLLRQWESDGAKFGLWKTDEPIDELRSRLVEPFLYDEELSSLKAASRKLEYLAVRILLKEMCGHELRIAHLPSGKPVLPDARMNITISHTKGYAAVGLFPLVINTLELHDQCRGRSCTCPEIGIDIERISERVRRASSRFIRDDELPGFSEMGGEEQLRQLLVHWTAKETMYKMLDRSGVDFQEDMRIMPFRLEQKGIVHGLAFSDRRFVIRYVVEQDFVLAYSISR